MKRALSACAIALAGAPAGAQCLQDKLATQDQQPLGFFGHELAQAGDLLVVAGDGNPPAKGDLHLFARVGADWLPLAPPKILDPEAHGIGSALAFDGTRIVVGARATDAPGEGQSGAAYVLEQGLGPFVDVARLDPPVPETLAWFGFSAALSGDTIVVGEPLASHPGSSSSAQQGFAHVFEERGGSWSLTATLVAPDPTTFASFGWAVALEGERLLVGAPGQAEAFLFERDAAGWSLVETLTPPPTSLANRFGDAVVLSGDTAVVGDWADDGLGNRAGAVHVYEKDAAGWSFVTSLSPPGHAAGDELGRSLAIDANLLVAGAPAAHGTGASYHWRREAGGWTFAGELTPPDAAGGDDHGASVEVSGDLACAASTRDDDQGNGAGNVYVFDTKGALCAPNLFVIPETVSATTGPPAAVHVGLGAQHAGKLYLVLVSQTPVTEPLVLDGVSIPLAPDALTFAALAVVNSPFLPGWLGLLGPQGNAVAGVKPPPGSFTPFSPALRFTAVVFASDGTIELATVEDIVRIGS